LFGRGCGWFGRGNVWVQSGGLDGGLGIGRVGKVSGGNWLTVAWMVV